MDNTVAVIIALCALFVAFINLCIFLWMCMAGKKIAPSKLDLPIPKPYTHPKSSQKRKPKVKDDAQALHDELEELKKRPRTME